MSEQGDADCAFEMRNGVKIIRQLLDVRFFHIYLHREYI